jgi:hypothetical protein
VEDAQGALNKGERNMNYHFKHIEYRLLFQHGWDRCPWFVDWREEVHHASRV